MSNKANIWISTDKWALITIDVSIKEAKKQSIDGTRVYIKNISNETVFGITYENTVIEQALVKQSAGQVWEKGKPNEDGYFNITNPLTKLALTAISVDCLEMKGMMFKGLGDG